MTDGGQFDAMMERYAIVDQIETYIDALNHRDWDRFASVLAEDLVWSISEPFNARVESRVAMLDLVKTHQEATYDFVFQMGHGIVVHDLQPRLARARHTMQEVSSAFMMIGVYYDELRKDDDGVWRFTRRDYRPTYCEKLHPPGNIFRRLPERS